MKGAGLSNVNGMYKISKTPSEGGFEFDKWDQDSDSACMVVQVNKIIFFQSFHFSVMEVFKRMEYCCECQTCIQMRV